MGPGPPRLRFTKVLTWQARLVTEFCLRLPFPAGFPHPLGTYTLLIHIPVGR